MPMRAGPSLSAHSGVRTNAERSMGIAMFSICTAMVVCVPLRLLSLSFELDNDRTICGDRPKGAGLATSYSLSSQIPRLISSVVVFTTSPPGSSSSWAIFGVEKTDDGLSRESSSANSVSLTRSLPSLVDCLEEAPGVRGGLE